MDLPTRDFPDQLDLNYIRLEHLSRGSHKHSALVLTIFITSVTFLHCLFVRLKAPLVCLAPVLAQSRPLLPE